MRTRVTMAAMAAMAAMATALLAACGGGGGNAGSNNDVKPGAATPTQQLASYVGTWVADCAGRAQETDVITQASSTTLSIDQRTDYYSGAGCTGFVVATQTQSGPITATVTGTADTSLALPPATTPSTLRVDLVPATVNPYTVTFTGTGVTHTTVNGQLSWCVDYAVNDRQCFADRGTQSGSSTSSALYVNGNNLYELTPSGQTYTVTQHFTKR